MKKKQLIITAASIAAAILVVILVVFLVPSEFEQVKNECVQIAGRVVGNGNSFMIDTYPDEYKNVNSAVWDLLGPKTQENALKAIQYANEAFGFERLSLSDMLETTAQMGRKSVENDSYKVSWTYHPDDGLEVTYTCLSKSSREVAYGWTYPLDDGLEEP